MFVLRLSVPDFIFKQGGECVEPQGDAVVKQFCFDHSQQENTLSVTRYIRLHVGKSFTVTHSDTFHVLNTESYEVLLFYLVGHPEIHINQIKVQRVSSF